MKEKKIGFTLIEMLVVIAIIALLAAIVIPSVTKALASAKRVACGSSLRQVGIGIMAYSADNKGFLPAVNVGGWSGSGPYWMESISEYMSSETGEIMDDNISGITEACPTWKGRTDVNERGARTKPGFGMNVYPGTGSITPNQPLWTNRTLATDMLKNPTNTIIVGDSVDWHLALMGNDWWTTTDNDYGYVSAHPDRHGNVANYLMADGSVQALRPEDALEVLRNPTGI